jgi:integrase
MNAKIEEPVVRESWNKGKVIGRKAALTAREISAVRLKLQSSARMRDIALFNLAIDSKLHACDLVRLRVGDVCHGRHVASRAVVVQQRTRQSVKFEITVQTREAVEKWIRQANRKPEDFLFPSRFKQSPHLSTRQYGRIVGSWVKGIGLDAADYGTHSLRRTKASLIYGRTRNLQAVQLLLGHSRLESTVRYLGIDIEKALEMAEQVDV